MTTAKTPAALAATAVLFSTLLSGAASAGSHSPLTVQIWNSNAEGLTTGQTYTIYAQVYSGDIPFNVSSITVRVGLGTINALFPATNYTPSYAGSPGLYSATVTVTTLESTVGLTGVAVFANESTDVADNFRVITFTPIPFGPGPQTGWSLSVGAENLPQLGRTVDPGEKIVWRIDTYNNGVHTNAPTLTAQLFEAPNVDFTETPTTLTLMSAGPGVYFAENLVPLGLTEGRQYVLQASLNETNFAVGNATMEAWLLEALVTYTEHTETSISGVLAVGDGVTAVANAAVSIHLSETGNPSHAVGNIQGQTNATGELAFTVANDGTQGIDVRGWVNETGGPSQFVAGGILLRPTFTPLSPVSTRFDAVPQQDISQVSWSGPQTIGFQFFANGTLWSSRQVAALISTARGALLAANFTTDGSGRANITIDFDKIALSGDDLVNAGLNFTFRAATGVDANSSDGFWWGEDEELAMPDPSISAIKQIFDTNLSFATETFQFAAPFGVATKYTGPKVVTGFKGAAVVSPAGLAGLFGGYTPDQDLWTGHGASYVSAAVRGPVPEYFATMFVPTYWPNGTYALIGAVVPTYSVLGNGGDPNLIAALNWTTIRAGEQLGGFVPSADVTPPQIFTPENFTINMHDSAFLWSNAYDDSLDFATLGTYTWDIATLAGTVTLNGNGVVFVPTAPGDYPVSLRVADATGNTAWHNFTVSVLDVDPPAVDAGADFTALGGVPANLTGVALDDDPLFQDPSSLVNWSFMYNGSLVILDPARAYPNVTSTFTFWTLGVYDVTLTAEDGAGHVVSDSVLVTVVSPDTIAPAVSAGPDRLVDAGTTVSFNGTATDNDAGFPLGAACGWNFTYNGTAHPMNVSDFSFTFWALGDVVVTYSCTDFWGNTGSDSATITVDRPDKVSPAADAGTDQSVYAGDSVSLVGSATDNDPAFSSSATYWWTFVDGFAPRNLTGASVAYTFGSAGDYTITFFARDGWGNVGTDTVAIHVTARDTSSPTVAQVPDVTIAEGGTAAVTASATDNDATFATTGNYTWTLTVGGAPQARYGAQFSFVFAAAGNYTVTLRVTDSAGNFAVRTFVVHVVAPDVTPPTVTASAGASTVQAGSLVNFTASATDGGAAITDDLRFNWTFTYNGTPQILQGRTASFRFEVVGTYPVTLSVADAAGNVGTQTVTVTVTEATTNPPPPPPTQVGGDMTVPILIAVLLLGGVGAFLMVRRRGRAAEPGGRTAPAEPRPGDAPAAPAKDDESRNPDEMDKDLDDLLR